MKDGVEGSTAVHGSTGVGSRIYVRQRGGIVHPVVLRAAVPLLRETAVEAEDDVPDYAVYGQKHRPGHCSSFGHLSLVVGAPHVLGGLGWLHCLVVWAWLHVTIFIGATHWATDPRIDDAMPLQTRVQPDGYPYGINGPSHHLQAHTCMSVCVCMRVVLCVYMRVVLCVCVYHCTYVCVCARCTNTNTEHSNTHTVHILFALISHVGQCVGVGLCLQVAKRSQSVCVCV